VTVRPSEVAGFRDRIGAAPAAMVRVEEAKGSTPRESGAWMVVGPDATLGTIGGGQLEYMAIDAARAMLARGSAAETLDIPLGPEIGQCCGGRTLLSVVRLEEAGWNGLAAQAERDHARLPAVMIFGAGHVGRALAAALALLPVRPVLVDGRAAELALAPARVERVQTPLPEAEVRRAPSRAAYVILTHDHALDFLIAREALARGDAAYVGMIGSRTKRVSFERWLARTEDAPDTTALVSPIGAAGRPDKRPEVIAAFVAAEILAALVVPVTVRSKVS
jgi:xanthine dehydrogenase accessory factor